MPSAWSRSAGAMLLVAAFFSSPPQQPCIISEKDVEAAYDAAFAFLRRHLDRE